MLVVQKTTFVWKIASILESFKFVVIVLKKEIVLKNNNKKN